jgi:hypothetical protein
MVSMTYFFYVYIHIYNTYLSAFVWCADSRVYIYIYIYASL